MISHLTDASNLSNPKPHGQATDMQHQVTKNEFGFDVHDVDDLELDELVIDFHKENNDPVLEDQ